MTSFFAATDKHETSFQEIRKRPWGQKNHAPGQAIVLSNRDSPPPIVGGKVWERGGGREPRPLKR